MLRHAQILWCHLARNLHTTPAQRQQVNYYDSLGIIKGSTQAEIKAAYYKLSMLYHPDRNEGSESAAKKFREITQAYEVLGNYRLRRLYDKGIVQTGGAQYAQDIRDVQEEVEIEEDDAQTKFYKSRFQKSKVADTEGRTPIYNFDEWSKAHYGKNFDRRQAAQAKYERMREQKEQNRISGQTDIVMLSILFCACAVYLFFLVEPSYDTPKQKAQIKHKRDQEQASAAITSTNRTNDKD